MIAEVARRLLEVTRDEDLCARWGGDEFVVILKHCDEQTLAHIGDTILDAISARPVDVGLGKSIRVGTSIGAHLVQAGDTIETASASADLALYAAKRQGRGRMVVFGADKTQDGGTMAAAHEVA